MAKTRDLHWRAPPTKECDQCKGSGIYRGLFSSGSCAECDGSGLVDEGGNPIPHDDLVAIMRQRSEQLQQRLDYARTKYKQLLNTPGVREAIAADREKRDIAARGYGSGKYHGD